jgi:hypothetical protein
MAPKETEISKKAAAGPMDLTLTIPETLEIISKPGNAISQSIIMVAYNIGLLTMHGTKKHKNILPARN